MRCPSCASLDTQVKDSRPTEDSAVIRRRRVCLACNFRFTTFERVQLRELTVIKRNGRRVPFDRDKLLRSVQIALRKRPVEPSASSRWSPDRARAGIHGRERGLVGDDRRARHGATCARSTTSPMCGSPRCTAISARPRISRRCSTSCRAKRTRARPRQRESSSPARSAAWRSALIRRSISASWRWRWRSAGAAWATPGPTRRSAPWSCATTPAGRSSSGAAGPRPAGARMPRPRRCGAPGRRRAARPSTSRSSRAPITAGRRPAPTPSWRPAIARVVSALEDPNPEVAGQGHARLRAAGIAVDVGVGAQRRAARMPDTSAACATAGPHVAPEARGVGRRKAGLAGRRPADITGHAARQRAHMLRATHDAMLIGIGTALADNPLLTCRLPGMAGRSPVRVVLDSMLRTPLTSRHGGDHRHELALGDRQHRGATRARGRLARRRRRGFAR